jgi:hypothetical protein
MNERKRLLREADELENRAYEMSRNAVTEEQREEANRLMDKSCALEYRALEMSEGADEPPAPVSADSKPSEVTDAFWLAVLRKKDYPYPDYTANSGKWQIFLPVAQIDELWPKIKLATEEGLLGDSSKVSTAKPNPNATSPDEEVICVYTYDSTDVADVKRIRQELRALGITWEISYKEDRVTAAGKYSNRGDKGISKYRE